MGCYCLIGIAFSVLQNEEFWRWIVVMVAPTYECALIPLSCAMIRIVNFIFCLFYHYF